MKIKNTFHKGIWLKDDLYIAPGEELKADLDEAYVSYFIRKKMLEVVESKKPKKAKEEKIKTEEGE